MFLLRNDGGYTPAMATNFDPDTPHPFHHVAREFCEHVLKIAAWSTLIAGVQVAEGRAGGAAISVCRYALQGALFVYIYTVNTDVSVGLIVAFERFGAWLRRVGRVFNVVCTAAIYWALSTLSSGIRDAIASLQSHP